MPIYVRLSAVQLVKDSTKYRGSEKSWRKRTAILQENCATEIGIYWTCVKRKQWKKCIGNKKEQLVVKEQKVDPGECGLMMSGNGQ